jgi:carboxymethylenebutenolidase
VTIDGAFVTMDSGGAPMRAYVVRPRAAGPFPGIVAFSDIFQLTPSTLRALDRLAGYGFVVAAPEIYHRIELAGAAFLFDDAGRDRGLGDAKRTTVAEFDADAAAVVAALRADAGVEPEAIGAIGWCLGGHLAFRAALQPEVRATTCFYATGVHSGELGADADAATLARAREIRGELLLIFGARDPHVPSAGRERIAHELERAGTRFTLELYDAEHAFMRDEGPRYDPELTDRAYLEAATFFRRAFSAS